MATVKAYSVCKSSGTNTASTVYSYGPAQDLQDGSKLFFDAATPEEAMRTGLSQAYSHGGVACTDTAAENLFQNEGLTQTLINPPSGATGAAASVALANSPGSNSNYISCDVICSTTNLNASNVGAGLIVSFTTSSGGTPAGTITIVEGGAGYAANDTVGIDGFPNTQLTISV